MRYVYRTFGWLLGVCLFLALGCGMEPQPEGIQHQAGPSNQQEYGVLQQAINLCNHTLTAGQSIRRTISITLPNVPPKADVMFASDLTSSMVEEVSKAKTNSTSIMNQITALIPDTAFGAMSFKDYAKSYKYCNYQTSTGGAVLYGSGQDFAYKLDQSITTNKTSVSTAINGWNISSDPNTDYPASYTRALWEMYNDTNVKWRTGSKRFILLFGDALPHDCSLNVPPYTLTTGPDPGRDQIAGTTDDLQWTTTITGLKNNNISLITLYSGPAKLKLGGPPLNVFDFWDIASQNTGGDAFQLDTQGNLPNKTNIADFIKTKVQALSATISNLTIGLCKDQSTTYNAWLSNPDSQTNVTSGTGPHSFGITVMPPTGTTPGAYTFDVCIYGDGVEYARQSCAITVSGCTLPGVGDPCSVGTGACRRTGTKQCNAAGTALECSVTAGTPTAETCDSIDNDCDGQIDENWPTKGQVCTVGIGACQRNGSNVCNAARTGITCSVSPGTPTSEQCDAIDNDCDGQVDEGFNKGQACTVGTGQCVRSGTYVCRSNGSGTQCSATAGTPTAEKCDNLDNDCDGQIDEGFNKGQACNVGTGECRRTGTYACKVDGSGTQCSATAGTPTVETCDGKDNDCDGQIDENWPTKGNACSVGVTECKRTGTNICNATGTGIQCSATAGTPTAETCDGKDNDCDGQIDEDFPTKNKACSVGVGECLRTGTNQCKSNGSGVQCSVSVGTPSAETCDGKDNDCDGLTDENWPTKGNACTSGKGLCRRAGTLICASNGAGLACSATPGTPSTETCNNGQDEDCDGLTDEGCVQPACSAGQTRSCYGGPAGTAGKGICKAGTQACVSGQWGPCVGEVLPATEKCDNIDNDCDGAKDETFANLGQACSAGTGECKTTGTYICATTTSSTICSAKAGTPTAERCDGKDNDCDGAIDENWPTLNQPCQGGTGACISTGKYICAVSGAGVECSSKGTAGTKELCDNIDNDCDGQVDEDFTTLGAACTVGVGECKATGKNRCKADKTGVECDSKPQLPSTEICDNKDNDCDGQIDESVTQACSSACGAGIQICQAGKFGACNAPKPTTELCDNKDNDCDGQIDNGLVRACTSKCGKGTETCAKGTWQSCSAPAPSKERCVTAKTTTVTEQSMKTSLPRPAKVPVVQVQPTVNQVCLSDVQAINRRQKYAMVLTTTATEKSTTSSLAPAAASVAKEKRAVSMVSGKTATHPNQKKKSVMHSTTTVTASSTTKHHVVQDKVVTKGHVPRLAKKTKSVVMETNVSKDSVQAIPAKGLNVQRTNAVYPVTASMLVPYSPVHKEQSVEAENVSKIPAMDSVVQVDRSVKKEHVHPTPASQHNVKPIKPVEKAPVSTLVRGSAALLVNAVKMASVSMTHVRPKAATTDRSASTTNVSMILVPLSPVEQDVSAIQAQESVSTIHASLFNVHRDRSAKKVNVWQPVQGSPSPQMKRQMKRKKMRTRLTKTTEMPVQVVTMEGQRRLEDVAVKPRQVRHLHCHFRCSCSSRSLPL